MRNLQTWEPLLMRFLFTRLRHALAGSRDERGGALVEFGLVVPIFVTLTLGAVTTGLSYNTNNSLNNGAREAARYGATLDIDGDINGWLASVADSAELATSGELGPRVASRQICVAFVHPDGTDADDRTVALLRTGEGSVIAGGTTCFDDDRPDDERRVQVRLAREAEIQAVVYQSTVDLQARSLARYERAD